MSRLVAIAYTEETLAGRAAEEIDRCADRLLIDPDATSVLICERNGKVRLTTSRRPGATAPWSALWGELLELVVGPGKAPSAIDNDFSKQLRGALEPGTSALLIALDGAPAEPVLETLSPLGGRPIAGSLPTALSPTAPDEESHESP